MGLRSTEELEKVAFREKLTAEEDDALAAALAQRSAATSERKQKAAALKQAAFFASRAFDKGLRDPQRLADYARILTEAQKLDPSDSFRRKLAEIKSTLAGKSAHQAVLKKLARAGQAGQRSLLASDSALDAIETTLGRPLPPSYRAYLKQYAHRQIGTYQPFVANDLVSAAREAWNDGLEPYLLPFLEDNADHFCFDLRSTVPEPPVVHRPHDGTSDETWPNFSAWVEECWLGELDD